MTESHRWKFDPTISLGNILMACGMVIGGLVAAITVYVGVIQAITTMSLRIDSLEKAGPIAVGASEASIQNKAAIAQLQALVAAINDSNGKMLEQLTGIRIDVGILKARTGTEGRIPQGTIR